MKSSAHVAQTSKSAVSQVSKPANPVVLEHGSNLARPADLEVGDTAGLETCATWPVPLSRTCFADCPLSDNAAGWSYETRRGRNKPRLGTGSLRIAFSWGKSKSCQPTTERNSFPGLPSPCEARG